MIGNQFLEVPLSNPNIYNAAKDGFLKNKYKNLIYDDTYKTIWVIW